MDPVSNSPTQKSSKNLGCNSVIHSLSLIDLILVGLIFTDPIHMEIKNGQRKNLNGFRPIFFIFEHFFLYLLRQCECFMISLFAYRRMQNNNQCFVIKDINWNDDSQLAKIYRAYHILITKSIILFQQDSLKYKLK